MSTLLECALKHHQEGRTREAKTFYRKVLPPDPEYPDALHYLGVLALQNGESAEAIGLIERSLAREPANAEAWNNLGLAFAGLGRWRDAEDAYRKALTEAPEFALVHSNLGDALMARGALEFAVASYRIALKTFPRDPKILVSLGNALALRGRYQDAIGHFRQVLEGTPDDPVALTNLGNALQAVGEADEAVAVFERAIAVQPDLAEAHFNLGMALYDQDRLEESITAYQKVLVLDPDNVAAHHHLGCSLFLQGRFREGWEEYEWRWWSEKGLNSDIFPQTLWQGTEVGGKTILVWSEQGVGDEILFAGMIPELVERGAKVVVECNPRLVPLFERSLSGVECVAKERPPSDEFQRREIDLQVPGGGLGRWLRPDLDSFHRRPYYLVADEDHRNTLRNRYRGAAAGFLVGISWESKNKQIGDLKSLPLDSFLPLFKIPGVTFVDLQYGDTAKERRNFEDKTGVSLTHDSDVDSLTDLDFFAAQVAAMDLVISVSNTTVHMAGALGVPTWVMLNTAPLLCWMMGRDVSPWYPSVKVFRQKKHGDWENVIERVVSELELFRSNRV